MYSLFAYTVYPIKNYTPNNLFYAQFYLLWNKYTMDLFFQCSIIISN